VRFFLGRGEGENNACRREKGLKERNLKPYKDRESGHVSGIIK
jgi:hypothetical protein